MLTRTQKEEIVSTLKAKIEKANAVFVTNLVGLTSNDAVRIRKDVRDANGSIVVTKNSLYEIAAKGTSCESLLSNLKGTNAVAFSYEDAAKVAKILYEANKEFEEIVNLKAGLLDGKSISKKEIEALAKLPSKEQMLATLLATFNAPVSAFVRVLDAIKTKQETAA